MKYDRFTSSTFLNNFIRDVDTKAKLMQPSEASQLREHAAQTADNINQKYFRKMDSHLEKREKVYFSKRRMEKAERAKQQFFSSVDQIVTQSTISNLREKLQGAEKVEWMKPQIFPRMNGDGFNVIVSPEKLQNLAFSGGGMMLLAYTSALSELDKLGEFDHVKKVAGSSAGGLVSAAISVSLPFEDLDKLITRACSH